MSEVVQILPHNMWHLSCIRDNSTSGLEMMAQNNKSKATLKELIKFDYTENISIVRLTICKLPRACLDIFIKFSKRKVCKICISLLLQGVVVHIRQNRQSKHQDQILISGHKTSDRSSWLKITVYCLLTSLLLSGHLNFQFRYKAMFSLSPSIVVISEISSNQER